MIKHIFKIKQFNRLFYPKNKIHLHLIHLVSTKRSDNSSTNRNEEQKEKLEKQENQKDDMWSILTFEKNITFSSISFYVLLAAVLALHFYNNANENIKSNTVEKAKERERKNLIELENKRRHL
ncbi:conserved Plasmodium protein, unknown function [Plasmodium ovale]|uniref:Uncharacterized protein n=2 Tax=Plasmodium ovale TaxID=36330 RepID=A0A1A8VLJ4_PLAOA|nr:conserved Plasmodium protein, unknown function [Plasmodium ovale curtisi]SBS81176.1 conserved Plasmodium protein, unknown function [Plasmodium ovale curtisi]SCN43033.1 conserved Plasmodium protein, unknown function [Plasmodium ovale]